MKNLQEKIEGMLQGEQKRREVAIKFLEKLTTDISDVAMELWGENGNVGRNSEPTPAVKLWRKKEGKREFSDIYFRYEAHYGENSSEDRGFYYSTTGWAYWGKVVEDEKGKDFWWSIRTIVEWLPLLEKEIEAKGLSRDELTRKLQLFIE